MLNVDGLEVRYGGICALRHVSIRIEKGETVLLIGANGAGKSSLIKSIIGLNVPVSGSITFRGTRLDGARVDERARRGIGYSPEGRRVFASMSVRDNVLAGAIAAGSSERERTFSWLSELFPILQERAQQPAGQLSGGQQQIVAFARAMSSSPSLLLLDEPFLGLAPVWIQRISDAIREIQQRGTTILMSEQMARPALKLATRGYLLRGGEVLKEGLADEIKGLALSEGYL